MRWGSQLPAPPRAGAGRGRVGDAVAVPRGAGLRRTSGAYTRRVHMIARAGDPVALCPLAWTCEKDSLGFKKHCLLADRVIPGILTPLGLFFKPWL